MNYRNLTFARGHVMDKFVHIELMINSIISAHFLGRVETDFVVNILNNEMSSFGFKKTVLKQIMDERNYNQEFQNLEKLNRIRNLFGHGSLNLRKGTNIAAVDAEIWFLDPKKVGQPADPAANLKTFDELFTIVSNWLIKVGKDKGVPYPE